MSAPDEEYRNDSILQKAIVDGSFFTLRVDGALRLVHREYEAEIDRLKTAYSIPTEKEIISDPPSPSQILYGADFDEVNRTLVGILALRWIVSKDYSSFVKGQSAKYCLSEGSFDWMCNLFADGLKDADDIYLLITSMVINDLGKSPTLAEDYSRLTHSEISGKNHDIILYYVMKDEPCLIPCLARLSAEKKQYLILGAKLGAEFNIGQFIQGENAPICLSSLTMMKGNAQAFSMWFMESLIDLAGALGHVDHTCAKILTQPVCESYQRAFVIFSDIMNGDLDARGGYDLNLKGKIDSLVLMGWDKGRDLNVHNIEHRAIMRLLCMSNVLDAVDADLVCDTLRAITPDIRQSLVYDLNVDGSREEPAIQPTYFPAICTTIIRSTEMKSKTEKSMALAASFRYLARTMRVDMRQVRSNLPEGVVVIERDMRKVLLQHIKSKEFLDNPDVLDCVDISPSEVAKMGEGQS